MLVLLNQSYLKQLAKMLILKVEFLICFRIKDEQKAQMKKPKKRLKFINILSNVTENLFSSKINEYDVKQCN
jgi:hypothetical protein